MLCCLAVNSDAFIPGSGTGSGPGPSPSVPTQVIIQFDQKPAALTRANVANARQRISSADSASIAAVTVEQASFHVAAAGIAFKSNHIYKHVLNGISVTLSGSPAERAIALAQLESLPQVKSISKQVTYHLDTLHSRRALHDAPVFRRSLLEIVPAPEVGILYNGNATGALNVNRKLNITGRGIKVGIIDTGIDYMHPDLGGGFGPGFRVAFGFDFMGDNATTAADGTLTSFPDNDPRDMCVGHGTHVAGIVGAHGNVVGNAPDVTLGAYRVFGCLGNAWDSVIIAAAEMAYTDGMDIINLSLGSIGTYPVDGDASILNVALENVAAAGVVVSTSAGNAGGYDSPNGGIAGLYSVGMPSIAPGVISVAATNDNSISLRSFTANPGNFTVTYGSASAIFTTNSPLGFPATQIILSVLAMSKPNHCHQRMLAMGQL